MSLRRLLDFLKLSQTTTRQDALAMAMINPALLTAGETAREALRQLAMAIFGERLE